MTSDLAALAFFAGAWEGHGKFLTTGIAQPVLRVEGAFRHRGHWLEQRFSWIEQGEGLDVLEATRLWGYDSAERRFVSEWFDSRGRRATVTSPGWTGDRLVAEAIILDGGRRVHARETFVRVGDDEWRHLAEADFGQGQVLIEEQTLRRVS
ncbi:DUF1579 family protein [Nonomuraea sp. B5E05]|uniref:DUF1579 family protein n=1 Tax=Nonomuraea sp. B5E05 TaxID=3153569 RepID=UPI003260ADDE